MSSCPHRQAPKPYTLHPSSTTHYSLDRQAKPNSSGLDTETLWTLKPNSSGLDPETLWTPEPHKEQAPPAVSPTSKQTPKPQIHPTQPTAQNVGQEYEGGSQATEQAYEHMLTQGQGPGRPP